MTDQQPTLWERPQTYLWLCGGCGLTYRAEQERPSQHCADCDGNDDDNSDR